MHVCMYTLATTGRYHFGSLGAACCRIGVTRCTYVVCKVYICKVYTRAVALRFALHLYVHMYTAVCISAYIHTHAYVCIRMHRYTCMCTYGDLAIGCRWYSHRAETFPFVGVSRFVNDWSIVRTETAVRDEKPEPLPSLPGWIESRFFGLYICT